MLNLSWMFSLTTLAFRLVSEDTTIFAENWKIFDYDIKKCPCFNWKYVLRVIFRCMDVTVRISVLSISWIAFGGYFTIGYICLDFVVLAIVSRITLV